MNFCPDIRTRRKALRWVTLLSGLALTACTGKLLPEPEKPASIFLLEVPTESVTKLNPNGPTLAIGAMRSAAGFGASDMLYQEHSYQLQAFARHRWADAPARMLEPVLVASAEQSGLFAGVVAPGSHASADLRLNAEVVRLQQVFDDQGSRIELTVRANITGVFGGRLLRSQVFDIREPATEATPYGGVAAANRATVRLAEALQSFFTQAVRQHQAGSAGVPGQ